MKAIITIILVLCVTLFLAVPPLSAQKTGDPEVKQIMDAAKKQTGSPENIFEYTFIRKVGNYALVRNCPKPKYINKFEGADIVLKKIGNKWVMDDMGTDIGSDYKKTAPGLFK